MDFEDEFSKLNKLHFYREFTYSKTTFRPKPSHEVELADYIIFVGDLLIVFQLKKRKAQDETNPGYEKKWFQRKVIKKAVKQVKDSIKYLDTTKTIEIKNHKNHSIVLDTKSINKIHKLIIYLPEILLPDSCRKIKYYKSTTVGDIHIISANDYLGIIRTLITPSEVFDYLDFRETLISKWGDEIHDVHEAALVGQYLHGNKDKKPSKEFEKYLGLIMHRLDEWDISGILSKFSERIVVQNNPTDYYSILQELAILKRNELIEFKKRYMLCLDKAKHDILDRPTRFTSIRTKCGFVFISAPKNMLQYRQIGLINYTEAHKYDQKLQRCIGISIAADTEGWYTTEWCYIDYPWKKNLKFEKLLNDNFPFLNVKIVKADRYTFKDKD